MLDSDWSVVTFRGHLFTNAAFWVFTIDSIYCKKESEDIKLFYNDNQLEVHYPLLLVLINIFN